MCVVCYACRSRLLHKQHALSSFKSIRCFREKRTTQNGGLFNQFLTCGLSAHHMNTIHDSKSLHMHCAFTFLTITLARPRLLDKQSLQKSVFDAVKQLINPSVVASICTADGTVKQLPDRTPRTARRARDRAVCHLASPETRHLIHRQPEETPVAKLNMPRQSREHTVSFTTHTSSSS